MQTSDLRREWTLKRNCSATPAQFAGLLATVAAVSFSIALVFAWSGAWWVLVFSLVEAVALAAAFVVYARHAGDYERVVVTPDALMIEFNHGNRVLRQQIHPSLTRVEYPCPDLAQRGDRGLIGLASSGRAVAIGRYVPQPERERLARDIRVGLLAASRGGGR